MLHHYSMHATMTDNQDRDKCGCICMMDGSRVTVLALMTDRKLIKELAMHCLAHPGNG